MGNLVIVAGGGGVLGRAVAADLLGRGFKVAIVDRMTPDVPGAVIFGDVDLTDDKSVGRTYQQVVREHGPIVGLVNVVGGFIWEPVQGGLAQSWAAMYRINLATVATSCRQILDYLDRGGAIVNVGAAAAANPGTGMAPYAASKAGVRALTESLADELRESGVRVNAVLPTIIDTPTNRKDMPDADTSNWIAPARAAAAIALLLSDDAAAITGACVPLSG